MNVLIVDDSAEFRAIIRTMLAGRFSELSIREAGDAQSALSVLASFDPDILFIDINLPGDLNGLALTGTIRAKRPASRIIVITSHDLPEYECMALKLGADCFLAKSSSIAESVCAAVDALTAKQPGVAKNPT